MDVRIAGSPTEGLFPEPEPLKGPSKYGNLFHKIRNKFSGRDEGSIRGQTQPSPDTTKKAGLRGIGVGPPRQQTFRRQNSEKRERLEPNQPAQVDRRAWSVNRTRASSVQPPPKQRYRSRSSPPPTPRHSLPAFERDQANEAPPTWKPEEPAPIASHPSTRATNEGESDRVSDQVVVTLDESQPSRSYDELLQQELDSKWILNLSMHFRDKSDREKFFLTYAERPTKWRRVTVSCDYRNAEHGSLEMDLKELHYQRDKNFQIYESIRESLPEIQFYDTVTNLKLETTDGRLHVHVTEDVNEIISYPPFEAIEHLFDDEDESMILPRLQIFKESEVEFHSHLSGFVYRVSVRGRQYIKKEIPGPDSVEEFLYEINALHALIASDNVIQLHALIVDDSERFVKGLLIGFAEKGALVDLLFDSREMGGIHWRDRVKWAEQIINGLNNIHEAGFVQGDFTLSNVVIDRNNDASIIDINRRGCPVGWEPPELERKIINNQRISMFIGVKSDIFQLGMTLWSLAMQDDEPERRQRPLRTDDFPRDVPEWYKTVVDSCLNRRPQDRLSTKELLDYFRVARRAQEHEHAVEEKLEQTSSMHHHRLPTPPKSRGDADSSSPPSTSYQDSTSSYFNITQDTSRCRRCFNANEPERGRRRSRNDELEFDDESDFEPQIVSISPGADQRFDEVELDGHPYLVSRNSFLPEDLEVLEHHVQGSRGSLDKSIVTSDPTASVETVGVGKEPSNIDNISRGSSPAVSAHIGAADIPLPPSPAPSSSSHRTRIDPLSSSLQSSSPPDISKADLAGFGGHPILEQRSHDEPISQVPFATLTTTEPQLQPS